LTSKNLRDLFQIKGEYHTFNREERYYAALLFHFLLKPKGLETFVAELSNHQSSISHDIDLKKVQIFFEYAHARDLWAMAKDNAKKTKMSNGELNAQLRKVITSFLNPPECLELSNRSDEQFNEFFGAKSKTQIQMPGRWNKQLFPWIEMTKDLSDSEIAEHREFAERVCKLIWAFNAKADLVIHTGKNQAICIEAKVVSAESTYRATTNTKYPERDYWANRLGNKDPYRNFECRQTEIQEYILKELLGYETTFVFLSKRGSSSIVSTQVREPSVELSWQEVFSWMGFTDEMSPSDELPFVSESLKSPIIS